MQNIKDLFLKYDGVPDDEKALDEYIDFVLSSSYTGTDYAEKHHMFPTAVYKKYNITNIIINIFYKDGITKMCKDYEFNKYLIIKYRNTGLKVKSTTKTKKSITNTIDWIFETIKK